MSAAKRKPRPAPRVRLKICGITNWTDAKRAIAAGADMLGFNFYRPSPRYLSPAKAKRIVAQLPKQIQAVGIFVNEAQDKIAAVAQSVKLHAVQLHGDEPPEQVARIARGWRVIKAFRVRRGFRLATLERYAEAHAFLLDGFSRTARGGTGKTFDWGVALRAGRYGRIFLAGGITPENIAQAIASAQPYAVDVCSGAEAKPGKKDAAKLRALGKAFREGVLKAGKR